MDEPNQVNELVNLRRFLKRLEANEMTLRRGGVDVTQHEISVLKREIDHLEQILARVKNQHDPFDGAPGG
jgi:hypothetical protein